MIPLCHSLCHGGSEPGKLGAICTPNSENLPVVWLDGEVPSMHEAGTQLEPRKATSLREAGVITFATGLDFPVFGPPVRVGEVWHLAPGSGSTFERAVLYLHTNGFAIKNFGADEAVSISWSPFSLVQSCRLHNIRADAHAPWLRLFRVSIFAHAWSHVFAVQGTDADADRARWVADIARVLRTLTQSLFPPFSLAVDPLPGILWTCTRLLAGYLLLCDEIGALLLYCELHSHKDHVALFNAYVDESCAVQVISINIKVITGVSEVVGIDCSCFSIDGRHFSARTCAEKMLWLRAISNLKVKLQHHAATPSPDDLTHYRAAIRDSAASIRQLQPPRGVLGQKMQGLPGQNSAVRPPEPCPVVEPPSKLAAHAALYGKPISSSAQTGVDPDERPGMSEDDAEDDIEWVESLPLELRGASLTGTKDGLAAAGNPRLPSAPRGDTEEEEAWPMGPPCDEAAKLSESVPVPKGIAASAAIVANDACADLLAARGEVQSI
mmetsp:Transcript_34658/g.79363  ORF Transcript_34658/g.79363 Transcript_34658/m.79363 type:complete len:495 (-) Transcript_34658:40-1524(-)